MTFPPPPGQPAYAAGPPERPRHLRGRVPLLLAAIFAVLGIGLAVGGGFVLASTFSTVDGFKRVPIDGQVHSVNLTRTGGYVVYQEGPNGSAPSGSFFLRIQDPSGNEVHPSAYGSTHLTYDIGSHHGASAARFHIDRAGIYRFQATSSGAGDAGTIAIGESFGGSLAAGVLMLVPGILFLVAAIVLLIVGLVRRSGHKRQLATGYPGSLPPPPGYGYPPLGYGSPPPGYGSQPGYGGAPPQGYQPPPSGYQPPSGQGYEPPR